MTGVTYLKLVDPSVLPTGSQRGPNGVPTGSNRRPNEVPTDFFKYLQGSVLERENFNIPYVFDVAPS